MKWSTRKKKKVNTVKSCFRYYLIASCGFTHNTIQYNTIQYNIFIFIIEFSHKYRKEEKTKIKDAENCASFSIWLSLWFRRLWDVILLRKYGGEVPIRGKYLSGGSTYQGEVPIRGKYLSGGSTYQGEVPIRGKYLSGGSTYQGEVPIRGKYLSGGSTYQGEVPIRGKYLSGGSTYQGEVPISGTLF